MLLMRACLAEHAGEDFGEGGTHDGGERRKRERGGDDDERRRGQGGRMESGEEEILRP